MRWRIWIALLVAQAAHAEVIQVASKLPPWTRSKGLVCK